MSTSATVVALSGTPAAGQSWPPSTIPAVALVRDFVPPAAPPARAASAEYEAFERGLAEGRRRTIETLQNSVNAEIDRLSSAIATLSGLRTAILKRSEQDIVTLALEMARRIVRREVQHDPPLLLDLARQAAATIAGEGLATIEMSPELYAAVGNAAATFETGPIRLIENSQLPAGSCLVRADAGVTNLSVDAQIQELFATLLDPTSGAPLPESGNDAH